MASPRKVISPISLLLMLLALFSETHLSFSFRNPKLNPNRQSSPLQSVTDVHDLLPQYGLPKGLLPNNVKSYTLTDDGSFTIELTRPCYVQFDRLVYYDKKVNGKLSYGSVSNVSGIQAKKLFLWVSVTGIQADKNSDSIEFYVGPLSEKLPAKQFENIPVCKSKACTTGAHPEPIWGNTVFFFEFFLSFRWMYVTLYGLIRTGRILLLFIKISWWNFIFWKI